MSHLNITVIKSKIAFLQLYFLKTELNYVQLNYIDKKSGLCRIKFCVEFCFDGTVAITQKHSGAITQIKEFVFPSSRKNCYKNKRQLN